MALSPSTPVGPTNSLPAEKKKWTSQTCPQEPTSIVKKPIRTSGSRKSLRLQSQSPISLSPHFTLAKSSSSPLVPISQLPSTKRKRSEDSEAEAEQPEQDRPAKQTQLSTPLSLEPPNEKLPNNSEAAGKTDGPESPSEQSLEPPLLSERDSQLLQSIYNSVMERQPKESLTWASSQGSTAQSGTGSDQTQWTSCSNAIYRAKTLVAANIELHVKPPDTVEATMKTIVDAEISEQRRDELYVLAKKFHDACLHNVRYRLRKIDFLGPLRDAIEAFGLKGKGICIRATGPWRSELKPIIRQEHRWIRNLMADLQQRGANDASAPLPKRQQQCKNEYMSPESKMTRATIPSAEKPQESVVKPPTFPVPEKRNLSPVKTPRPDLSIGIDVDTLISALYPTLNRHDAGFFIRWLEAEMVQLESGGPFEPMLISIPATGALDLTFPFAVIEGKAYSTGKQIFEAEDQAAVSMACVHKILHRLDRIAKFGTTASTQERVLFSITTQGPIHELWAHWTVVSHGELIFESAFLDSWNALSQPQASDFIVKLYKVCLWGTGPYMESVVKSLKTVATLASNK